VESNLLSSIERGWEREVASGDVARQLAAWRLAHSGLRRFATPHSLLRFLHGPGDSAAKDQILAALLTEAPADDVAARLVLRAIVPGLRGRGGRALVDAAERDELWSAVVANAWERIRTYPAEGGPRRVAAALVLNAVRDALRELGQRRRERAELDPRWAVPSTPPVDADVEGLLGRAVAAGALSEREAELVLASRIDGQALASVAEAEGVAYNTMKLSRQRAERRLLLWLGYRAVPRGQQRRPSSSARVAGAGPLGQAGGNDQPTP
jgi:DNA-directed RNA polymerase specialized sigma24 family protein